MKLGVDAETGTLSIAVAKAISVTHPRDLLARLLAMK
jgi:hypothetical protein